MQETLHQETRFVVKAMQVRELTAAALTEAIPMAEHLMVGYQETAVSQLITEQMMVQE